MNITQLRYFQAICTFHSVSSAAEYLHISQPSLSNAIKDLEKEFGVVLFRRHHRGMALTTEGEALLRMSHQILGGMDQAEDLMLSLGKERKRLRLGVPPMIGSLILPKIYRDFLPGVPEISLRITEGGRQELMQKLRDDHVDMAFISHSGPLEKIYDSVKIAQFPIVFCTTKHSPLSKLPSVKPEDVAKNPLVLFVDSFFQTEKIKKWFSNSGITPKIIMQTEQLSTIQSIIAGNIASGFMFRQLADANPELIAIPVEQPMMADISLVWKRGNHLSDSMKSFINYVKIHNPLETE